MNYYYGIIFYPENFNFYKWIFARQNMTSGRTAYIGIVIDKNLKSPVTIIINVCIYTMLFLAENQSLKPKPQ